MKETIERQVDKFISHGFHEVLGQTESQYRESFEAPLIVKGLNVVVDPRIPATLVIKAAGIYSVLPPEIFTNTKIHPDVPYVVRVMNTYLSHPVEEAFKLFSDNEVAMSHIEIIFTYFVDPRSIFEYGAIAGESHFGKFHAVFNPFGVKRLEMHPLRPDFMHSRFGVMSRQQEAVPFGML